MLATNISQQYHASPYLGSDISYEQKNGNLWDRRNACKTVKILYMSWAQYFDINQISIVTISTYPFNKNPFAVTNHFDGMVFRNHQAQNLAFCSYL